MSRFSVAALLSGLLHAAVLYSLTKLPEIPQNKNEYIRINLGKVVFLKEEKIKKPPERLIKAVQNPKVKTKKKRTIKIKKNKVRKARKRVVAKRKTKKFFKKTNLPQKPYTINTNANKNLNEAAKNKNLRRSITGKNLPSNSSIVNKMEYKKYNNKSIAYSSSFKINRNYEEIYRKLNLSKIRKLVQASINYPYIARRMGWEGKVSIEVVLTPTGCKKVNLKKSSGHKILDKNALETVKRLCGKFPKPQKEVVILIPIVYKLN